jgi:signal transduction histidine kinase
MQLNIYSKEIKVINLITPKSIIKTDPNFVHIIIRNLLQNGIKASPYKGVIEVGFCITKNRKSCFWITNSGSQFSQENYLETLQRKNTSQNLHQGLGLKLVEELSRRIGVEVQFDVIDKNKTCCSLFF